MSNVHFKKKITLWSTFISGNVIFWDLFSRDKLFETNFRGMFTLKLAHRSLDIFLAVQPKCRHHLHFLVLSCHKKTGPVNWQHYWIVLFMWNSTCKIKTWLSCFLQNEHLLSKNIKRSCLKFPPIKSNDSIFSLIYRGNQTKGFLVQYHYLLPRQSLDCNMHTLLRFLFMFLEFKPKCWHHFLLSGLALWQGNGANRCRWRH